MLALMIAVTAACGTLRPVPELTPDLFAGGEALGFTREELVLGRAEYLQTCNECHAHPDPLETPVEGWESVLSRMLPKTRSGAADAAAIRAFVLTASAVGR